MKKSEWENIMGVIFKIEDAKFDLFPLKHCKNLNRYLNDRLLNSNGQIEVKNVSFQTLSNPDNQNYKKFPILIFINF